MAQRLVEFYNQAMELGQAKARMRMAILTRISSVQAEKEPDSPENIARFNLALEELRKEFKP